MEHENGEQQIVAMAGLDWADKEHVIRLQKVGSPEVESFRIKQTPESLSEWVRGLREKFGEGKVAIGIEQSRGAVMYHLIGYDYLLLYPINPKSLAKYREAFYPSGAKDDPVDADLLLELVGMHRDRLRAWRPNDEGTRTLAFLAEHRRKLVNNRTRVTNRITSLLKEYYPQAVSWAGDLKSLMACEFLQRWPTLSAIKAARPDTLRKFYQQHGARRKEVIEGRISEVRSAVPLTTDAAIMKAYPLMLQASVGELRSLTEAIKSFDQEIESLYKGHPDHDLVASLPGAGPALGPRIISAMGSERERFESAAEVQQFSGIAPVTERSGKSMLVRRRLACSKFLRQTFHEFAGQSILFSKWARAYYDQQKERGKEHHAAVRALAFKWIRIIFRCWKDRVCYSEDQYIQSLIKRGSSLVKSIGATAEV
jgi:transposase